MTTQKMIRHNHLPGINSLAGNGKKRSRGYILLLSGLLFLFSCAGDSYTPKPKGYTRIDFPGKAYQTYQNDNCPFSFEYPAYGILSRNIKQQKKEPCWMNLEFPDYDGIIHLSYKSIHTQEELSSYIDDSHTMVYKHTVKAESIQETRYDNTENRVHGILYQIGGNAASSVQFFVTDSSHHFLRGAFYIETTPNQDSLAPVIDFFKEDIIHLMETISWH